jgi:hypothetical protein
MLAARYHLAVKTAAARKAESEAFAHVAYSVRLADAQRGGERFRKPRPSPSLRAFRFYPAHAFHGRPFPRIVPTARECCPETRDIKPRPARSGENSHRRPSRKNATDRYIFFKTPRVLANFICVFLFPT